MNAESREGCAAKAKSRKYQAVVYHGGNLLGLGRWGTGKQWTDRDRAVRDGERMAAQCQRIAGGLPIVVIEDAAIWRAYDHPDPRHRTPPMARQVLTCDACGADQDTLTRETCEFCGEPVRLCEIKRTGEETFTVEAAWVDETTGEPAAHVDPSRGYYEAHLPSGTRITANDRYCPGSLGDVWHADDDHGGGYEIDTPEFQAATIRFIGGPRADEEVS